jgi:hypothetical protein
MVAASLCRGQPGIHPEETKPMTDDFVKLFEAAKDLVAYIDKEHVFDKAADMGCGGFDTYQSDAFFDLIAEARKALSEVESTFE